MRHDIYLLHVHLYKFRVFQCCGLEMDKENGKGNESSSGSSKVSNVQDSAALLDAASLFGGKNNVLSQFLAFK